jgi:hypothetical protein
LVSTQIFGGTHLGLQRGGGGTQTPSSHLFGKRHGGRQTLGSRRGVTDNFMDTITSSALMLSIRSPLLALAETSKETDILRGVPSLTRMFEIPAPGLTETCEAATFERSNNPEELTVIVGDVPA